MTQITTATLQTCYVIYKHYEDILNSYVSDYYVDSHWSKLPKSWQKSFENISVDEIASLLDYTKPITTIVHPLSLLCLRKLIENNSIPRKRVDFLNGYNILDNKTSLQIFWKNVKLKKRHEINIMAQMCNKMAVQTNTFYIVDIGSGLGHLSRMLSYGYGFKVCTFEANPNLCCLAEEMDKNFESTLNLKKLNHKNTFRTVHLNKKIDYNLPTNGFLDLIRQSFNEDDESFRFGIVGLHPCGDLGSKLLKLYDECPNAVFINIASCCYMKLTLSVPPSETPLCSGFPLSTCCKKINLSLTYLSCEIACHAIENYVKKLREPKSVCQLKIHAYRAALEMIIISINQKLKHSPVCSVKYDENLSFKMYCDKALKKFNVKPSDKLISLYDNLINKTWKNVVIFYSVRLLLAPLVETIILLDRLLFVEESESKCNILPLFDCNISPRSHVLSASKIKYIEKY